MTVFLIQVILIKQPRPDPMLPQKHAFLLASLYHPKATATNQLPACLLYPRRTSCLLPVPNTRTALTGTASGTELINKYTLPAGPIPSCLHSVGRTTIASARQAKCHQLRVVSTCLPNRTIPVCFPFCNTGLHPIFLADFRKVTCSEKAHLAPIA